jgi:Domain of unknown function (DUF4261)
MTKARFTVASTSPLESDAMTDQDWPPDQAQSAGDAPAPLLAMVALRSSYFPTAGKLLEALRRVTPAAELGAPTGAHNALAFELNGNHTAVGLMPAPIPWTELEGPCATAWWWPEATEMMRDHTHHAIVLLTHVMGSAATRHVDLTHLAAAVAETSDAVGIYWGGGTLVHKPEHFIDEAKQLAHGDVAPHLWIDMRLEQNDDGSYRFFTTGMSQFQKPEIEITRTTKPPPDVLAFCHDMVHYILSRDKSIADGETVGRTGDERIKVSHGPSMLDERQTVMRLAY